MGIDQRVYRRREWEGGLQLFEDQPYFDGFRDLATNGIDKPVLNVFRMFGMMDGQRLAVKSSGALELDAILKAGVKGAPDVNAVATRGDRVMELSR